jgi:PAS domain S-box-containing protein
VVERVETAAAMTAALAGGKWDLVLSDFALPRFSAPEALKVLHDSGQDLPFIIISGSIQEEDAVASLRAGAHDFIVKDRLTRLVPAITRELRDAENRAAHRREQETRLELESGYQLLFANSPLPMWMYDPQTLQFVEVNEATIATYGYSRDEFLQMRITDIRPAKDVRPLVESLAKPRGDFRPSENWRHYWKDGSLREVEIAAHSLEIGGRALSLAVVHDVTERRQVERDYQRRAEQFALLYEAGLALNSALDARTQL